MGGLSLKRIDLFEKDLIMNKTIKWEDDTFNVSITAKNDPATLSEVYEYLIKPMLLSIGFSEKTIKENFE